MSDRTLTPAQRQKAQQKRMLRANPPSNPCARTLPDREQQSSQQHAAIGQQCAQNQQ